jgi:uncharacterized protein
MLSGFEEIYPSIKNMNNLASDPKPGIQAERLDVIDALRGFAVFGMFMINIRVFSGYTYISGNPDNNLFLSGWNTTFDQIHIVFFNGKFYTLFALLFGIGFALQLFRNSGKPFLKFYNKRLFFLLLIGIIHLWGIWFSDILVFYALCGYILILFRDLSEKQMLWTVVLLLMIPALHSLYINYYEGGYTNVLYQWVSNTWLAAGLPTGSTGNDIFGEQDIAQVIHGGSWATVLRFNSIGPVLRLYIMSLDARIFKILAVFVLGFWAGRKIVTNNLHKNRVFLIRTALVGWLTGLPLNIFLAMDNNTILNDSLIIILKDSINQFGYLCLAVAYCATFILIYQSGFKKFLNWSFNSVGKTALTNYILQSLLGILIFYSAGLGLGRYSGSFTLTVAVVLIFGLQIFISNLWLKHFRQGPVEWLWKSFSYGHFKNNRH